MTTRSETLEAVRRALSAEPRIDLARHRLATRLEDGVLTLEGEVAHVGAKRLALSRAAAVAGVEAIVDRVRVARARPMSDPEIRDAVRRALVGEPALAVCALRQKVRAWTEVVQDPPGARGLLEWSVEDGVVTLDGEAPSLEHKRLAGVLAWWVPGARDVVNGLAVEPPEPDDDDRLREAVRLVLEKDPFVDAGRVRVAARNGRVTLDGVVPGEAEREMAEADAWYVFGVEDVENRLEARPLPRARR